MDMFEQLLIMYKQGGLTEMGLANAVVMGAISQAQAEEIIDETVSRYDN